MLLFHITSRGAVAEAAASGSLRAPSLEGEGFIHCSYAHQVAGTLQRFFPGQADLVLVELDPARLGARLVEEGGFPHVYGAIAWAAVRRVSPLASDATGNPVAPAQGEVEALLRAFAWYDHPEGPKFVETHRDAHRTSGHWLFLPGAVSAFHQVLNNEELWVIHAGRLAVHVIDGAGALVTHRLGLDVSAGERPVVAVPRGAWQAAELAPGEAYAFGTNVCAPPFEFSEFQLGSGQALAEQFPAHEALVRRLAVR